MLHENVHTPRENVNFIPRYLVERYAYWLCTSKQGMDVLNNTFYGVPTIFLFLQGAMYGMAQSIPDRSLVSEIASFFYDAYYDTSKKEHAAVNGKH